MSNINPRAGIKRFHYPRIYALLKRQGHDPMKAFEIILDATRNDNHARAWIGAMFKFRHA